jgi:3-mercaptopyruvate sulfurtransferase SseA
MPFQSVIDPETGELKDSKELADYFRRQLGRFSKVITTCGTGRKLV